MSVAAAVLLVAVAVVQTTQPAASQDRREGPVIESALVSVAILRPAVLRAGALVSIQGAPAPHSQVVRSDGRITYEFE